MDSISGLSINIKNLKCFDDSGSGFFKLSKINLLIGRNNVGKSSLIDTLDACTQSNIPLFLPGIRRNGTSPVVQFKSTPQSDRVDRQFPRGFISSGHEFPKELKRELVWEFNENRRPFINVQDSSIVAPSNDFIEQINNLVDFPFENFWLRRISAERDVIPEQRVANRSLSPSGSGLTNLIRAFITARELDRSEVEIKLLSDLNYVFGQDTSFERISVKIEDVSDSWEIFVTENLKPEVALSQSGSSLKSILIILAYLHLVPLINSGGPIDRLILCIEEPENNLHPYLLRRLLELLAMRREEMHFALVISTHSSICIDWAARRQDTAVLHIRNQDGKTLCSNVLDHIGRRGILDDIAVRGSDILQSNGIIWVEGPSDRIYINFWIDMRSNGSLREGTHYTFLYYGGRILSHFEVDANWSVDERISLMLTNRNVAVVIDSDRMSLSKSARKPPQRLNATKRRIISEVQATGGFHWVTEGREIENYVQDDIWNKLADTHLGIDSEFVNIPEILKAKGKGAPKVELAHEAVELMSKTSFHNVLDLFSKVDELCRHIRRWNGIYGE